MTLSKWFCDSASELLFCSDPTVGYIVGLGDRHIQNILIDELTAELVHIDLGKIIHSLVLFMQTQKVYSVEAV